MTSGAAAGTAGTVSFHFSTTPVATSSWCLEGCQPPGSPRCCIRLRPVFDLFRLLAGMKHAPGYRHLMSGARTALSAVHLTLTVERSPETGYCGLWTPDGCRLPAEAKPDPCRHYVCKTDLFQGDAGATAVLDRYNRFWLALLEHELEHAHLEQRAREHFQRTLNSRRAGGQEPLPSLFDTLEYLRDHYEEYLARRRELVRELLGAASSTVMVRV